jgi:hypothetical protein
MIIQLLCASLTDIAVQGRLTTYSDKKQKAETRKPLKKQGVNRKSIRVGMNKLIFYKNGFLSCKVQGE